MAADFSEGTMRDPSRVPGVELHLRAMSLCCCLSRPKKSLMTTARAFAALINNSREFSLSLWSFFFFFELFRLLLRRRVIYVRCVVYFCCSRKGSTSSLLFEKRNIMTLRVFWIIRVASFFRSFCQ